MKEEYQYEPKSAMDEELGLESAGAHSTVRRGGSDYTDGADVTHYLGNDDHKERNSLNDNAYARQSNKNPGKVANGNLDH